MYVHVRMHADARVAKSRARQIGRQTAAMALDECVFGAFIMRQYSLEMSTSVILTGSITIFC